MDYNTKGPCLNALPYILYCQRRQQYKYAMRFLPHREHSPYPLQRQVGFGVELQGNSTGVGVC
jgi:hypothetical protein